MSNSQIQKKLDLIAKHINDLDALLKQEYGRAAHVYVESEGSIHAMSGFSDANSIRDRQAFVVASSPHAKYDCGAW
jgi:hypothetical protein